ncbi:D-alanyl-D-alanine endopeptidase [Chitiniphilus purpureus]|uniref:D-alanyl-D-alanine endopeptidase n=1 Tax=Chitiniphilus purpureus TaxID=2981137 RepID=A0ABY6DJA4_9NEIS|nr:D-alanyl-D-alanine endopeptidase [Chitiniphilus sp. CD1]UXY14424.1 D-alanyl-D-alanine endopeptidase [Chitiniphilus sp. CD1]
MRNWINALALALLAASFVAPVSAAPQHGKESAGSKQRPSKKNVRPHSSLSREATARARTGVKVARAMAPTITEHPGVQSAGVLVLNERSGEVVYEKSADDVAPIASITKLMTAMVVLDAGLPMNEILTIGPEDVDLLKNTSSRLNVGTALTRAEMLLLALMSSENRAASALSRHYPGGQPAFLKRMNEKARELGMGQSRFFDATGLSPANVSTPRELARMVKAARHYPEIQHFSTASEYAFVSNISGRELQFRNTNPLVREGDWTIGLSKTGYTNEAGRCLVMQATINGSPIVMVLLDSNGKYTRIGDANRVRKWLETSPYARMHAGTF